MILKYDKIFYKLLRNYSKQKIKYFSEPLLFMILNLKLIIEQSEKMKTFSKNVLSGKADIILLKKAEQLFPAPSCIEPNLLEI